MSTTRLMVLGVVRIFQPAHGYFLRRELVSWQVESWAKIKPGSIYNALRTLTREGYLAEDASEQPVRYRLTLDGENEFKRLLRDSLWTVDEWDNSTLLGGLCLMGFLRRDEVIDAMESRAASLGGLLKNLDHKVREITENRAAPAATVEGSFVAGERLAGELAWCEKFADRLRAGYYRFTPEPGWNSGPLPDGRWPGPLDPGANQA